MDPQDALSFNSEHRLRAENLSYDIDVWYPKLKQFTMKSIFLPLKRNEAEAILAFHDVSWRNCKAKPYLTRNEVKILQEFEKSIDEGILMFHDQRKLEGKERTDVPSSSSSDTSFFARLCGRSPKDGEPYCRTPVWESYQSVLRHLIEDGGLDASSANTEMIAISRTKYLSVKNGKDVMSLLLTSERVYAEMIDWLRYGKHFIFLSLAVSMIFISLVSSLCVLSLSLYLQRRTRTALFKRMGT
jgi:hypothetical protein